MMNKHVLILFGLLAFFCGFAQERKPCLDSLNGLWLFQASDESSEMDKRSVRFKKIWIQNGNKFITITIWDENIYIPQNPFGYVCLTNHYKEPALLSQLGRCGNRIITFDDSIKGYDNNGNMKYSTLNSIIGLNYEHEEDKEITSFAIIGLNGQPNHYGKVGSVPDSILVKLQKNKPDWLKYTRFVKMRLGIIRITKAFFYDNNFIKKKSYLLLNDEVELLETNGEFVKVKYYGGNKIYIGWLKKEDVI